MARWGNPPPSSSPPQAPRYPAPAGHKRQPCPGVRASPSPRRPRRTRSQARDRIRPMGTPTTAWGMRLSKRAAAGLPRTRGPAAGALPLRRPRALRPARSLRRTRQDHRWRPFGRLAPNRRWRRRRRLPQGSRTRRRPSQRAGRRGRHRLFPQGRHTRGKCQAAPPRRQHTQAPDIAFHFPNADPDGPPSAIAWPGRCQSANARCR